MVKKATCPSKPRNLSIPFPPPTSPPFPPLTSPLTPPLTSPHTSPSPRTLAIGPDRGGGPACRLSAPSAAPSSCRCARGTSVGHARRAMRVHINENGNRRANKQANKPRIQRPADCSVNFAGVIFISEIGFFQLARPSPPVPVSRSVAPPPRGISERRNDSILSGDARGTGNSE